MVSLRHLTPAALLACMCTAQDPVVGKRPYELDWAGRTTDLFPAAVDFEKPLEWHVETHNAEAGFERSHAEQIWGEYVARLTYRATGSSPTVRVLVKEPLPIAGGFDTLSLWVYGNNWAWIKDSTTPAVSIHALLRAGNPPVDFGVPVAPHVNWKEWFVVQRRLAPDQIARVTDGALFLGFEVRGGLNREDRTVYLDSLCAFRDPLPALEFSPRARPNLTPFPGQDLGTRTATERLPFPTREQTILPPNATTDFETAVEIGADGRARLEYRGVDGHLVYRVTPSAGTWDGIRAAWDSDTGSVEFSPCTGGGVRLATADGPRPPETASLVRIEQEGDAVVQVWDMAVDGTQARVRYAFRIWNKSLVIDVSCPERTVAEVVFGSAADVPDPRLVTNPYYTYGAGRPAAVVMGPVEAPLFFMAHIDWYRSGASLPWAAPRVRAEAVFYSGGTRYIPCTNGVRNPCFERVFLTLAPRYAEVLPEIPNPVSPWKHVTGTGAWRAHGASDRQQDREFWRRVHRYGMRRVIVTDHETMWRDGGESFTFRTRAAPGKGGDQGARDYSRFMQDELGFVYGPYNNYTDMAAVNGFFHPDHIVRTPDNQLQTAWPRCYAPKSARAVEFCERLAPEIQTKFGFSTAYCDVHTAIAPWDRTDYDARVPGAGTFAAVFYDYGEIMLLQKQAWNGPVYSEGNHHAIYSGLTDGNYAQDQDYRPAENPWLVDFDLLRIHPLCCNFGMGNPGMFYPDGTMPTPAAARERDAVYDRFFAATVAFGHPPFLTVEGGFENALRSYYMLQQLAAAYTQTEVESITYVSAGGELISTETALATGAYRRSQVVTTYRDGTVTVVNGHPEERLRVRVATRDLDLPPNGYAGWTADGRILVHSSDRDGHRTDYAVTPAYLFIDGRGSFTRQGMAASAGAAVCRVLDDGGWEVIPYEGAECGFAVPAGAATALDEAGEVLGPAGLRTSRGLTYVLPVANAFSYRLSPATQAEDGLECERDRVVPGEQVVVRGTREHNLAIPEDTEPGTRFWASFKDRWIDFTVVPLADVDLELEEGSLRAELKSNLAVEQTLTLQVGTDRQQVQARPGRAVRAVFSLQPATTEGVDELRLEVRAGTMACNERYVLQTRRENRVLADLPRTWTTRVVLRRTAEEADPVSVGAYAKPQDCTCGGETKVGVAMHPPWKGATGAVLAEFPEFVLPDTPAVLRAAVGKVDGSDPGDGILYRVEVREPGQAPVVAASVPVTRHEWQSLEADLTPWQGRTVSLALVADVGERDDPGGDWACWADMRIETPTAVLVRRLGRAHGALQFDPPPLPLDPIPTEDGLRTARRGWIHYDGQGFAGSGAAYGSIAFLNGHEIGEMTPAGGVEVRNIWDRVALPIPAPLLTSLGYLNTLEIHNPRNDFFKLRRFWIELEFGDGRRYSSRVSAAAYSQPPSWPFAEGIPVPHGTPIRVDIWFERAE
jgi:hypothetical protein